MVGQCLCRVVRLQILSVGRWDLDRQGQSWNLLWKLECDSLRSRPAGHKQLPKLLGIGTRGLVTLGRTVLSPVVCPLSMGINLLVGVGEGANVLQSV